jgi:AraC-like DNA-binding protein
VLPVGVRFRPGSAAAVLGLDLTGAADRELPLALPLAATLRAAGDVEAALEAAARWIPAAPLPATRPAVARILAARGNLRIEELAAELGTSRRRLERQFARELGVTPKTYARIVRLQSVLATLDEAERTRAVDLALDAGYFDQPHLLRDFRSLAGRTPRAGRDADGELARHFTHPDRLRALLAGR